MKYVAREAASASKSVRDSPCSTLVSSCETDYNTEIYGTKSVLKITF